MKYQLRYSNNIHRIMASNLIESLYSLLFPFIWILHFYCTFRLYPDSVCFTASL